MTGKSPTLSISEKSDLFWVIGTAPFRVAWTGLRHFLIPPKDSPGVARIMATTVLKTFSRLSTRQTKAFITLPSTGQTVEKYCSKNKLQHEVAKLPHNTKLHFIGSRPTEGSKVLLYFHGGGYNNPSTPEHIKFSLKCASNADVTLAMLEYTLAPEGHFPTQTIQAAEALKHILTITSPSKVLIAGDSAGGHLLLSLLSHIMHPSKDIDPISLSENLAGVCPISPFLSFDYNKSSYEYNDERDYISLKIVKEFNANFKKPLLTDQEAVKDPRMSPLDAPAGWWANLPVDRILLTMGEWETFFDDCKAFGKRLENEAASKTKLDIVVGRKEVHVACVQDTFLGKEDGDTWNAILAWMSN